MTTMKDRMDEILRLLPECRCTAETLCRGAEYFLVEPAELKKAAAELALNHDLNYDGVRRLLALCLEDFGDIFSPCDKKLCEVTVPSPACAMYALQAAAENIHFSSSAFFAQIVLRGIFLHREPIDITSCARRRCGLNKMRQLLLTAPPVKTPEYQIEFGALCDECCKIGEGLSSGTVSIPVNFVKSRSRNFQYKTAEELCLRISSTMGIRPERSHINQAFAMYGRLMKALKDISALNLRPDRRPLSGNSLALAQSVSLMCTARADAYISALEILAAELERAPAAEPHRRFYCFYVPFLQPEVDRRFRENGVSLIENAAFLTREKAVGFDLPGIITAWLESMGLRADTGELSELIASEMEKAGCDMFITGAFAFDRWLGSTTPLLSKLLAAKGIKTRSLEADFWCENVMFGSVLNRIDQICMK